MIMSAFQEIRAASDHRFNPVMAFAMKTVSRRRWFQETELKWNVHQDSFSYKDRKVAPNERSRLRCTSRSLSQVLIFVCVAWSWPDSNPSRTTPLPSRSPSDSRRQQLLGRMVWHCATFELIQDCGQADGFFNDFSL
jgi:hypothetical protein